MYKKYDTNGHGMSRGVWLVLGLWNCCRRPNVSKWLMRINLTCLVLTIACLQLSFAAIAQKVSLSKKNAPITEIFRELRKQTGYDFVINKQWLQLARPVTVQASGDQLLEVLDRCFKDQPFSYVIEDKMIVVVERKKEPTKEAIPLTEVRGRVVDENGKPLVGALVVIKGTDRKTLTDADGNFAFRNVEDSAVVIISHVGYEHRGLAAKVDLGNVAMTLAIGELQEVKINAGYYKVSQREMTGNIARVTAKDIENQPVTNVFAAVKGRMAGVSIVQNSGSAGGGFEVQIRGKNSLRFDGNYPLIIVDGVPSNAQSNSLAALSTNILSKGEASPLNTINPNDIESIEVLKDADATAIYGSRGANGVVIVTTKRGKKGSPILGLTTSTSFSKTGKLVEMATTEQYLQLRKDAFANDAITSYPIAAYDLNGRWGTERYTDWYKEFIGRNYMVNQQQLTYAGGGENAQYYLSFSNLNQGTAFGHNLGYKRSGLNFNTVLTSPDAKLKISPTIYYTREYNNQTDADLTRQIVLAPNAPALYDGSGQLNWEQNTFTNPLAKLENKYTAHINTLVTNINTIYDLSGDWAVKLNAGYSQTQQRESRTNPSSAFNPNLGYTSATSVRYEGIVSKMNWVLEPQLHWNRKWGVHKISTFIGTTFENRKEEIVRLQGSDFTSNEFIANLSNAKVQRITQNTTTQYRYTALFGRLNYSLSEKYMLNLTARRDGSSRFGSDRRFANFGALGTAWLFSEERLVKERLPWISYGKLRMSIGTSGSDLIGDYQFLDTYTTSSQAYDGTIGIYPSRLFNPNFSWEKTTKFETAIELGLLENRMNVSVAWFRNRSSNQLVGIPQPATTGFPSIQSNFPAKVQNSGTELDLQFAILRNTAVKWKSSINFTQPKSKLLQFDGLKTSTYASTYEVGSSLYIKKVYELKGVNPSTGLYEFSDLNGDGKFDANDRIKVVDLGIKYFGGIGSQLTFRKWSLDFLFQFVKQRQFNLEYSLGMLGTMSNIPTYLLDYWTPENPSARFQRPSTGANANASRAFAQFQGSDAVIVDASYVRLNNVHIGYQIPFEKKYLKSITLQLHGQNLLTLTGYKGIDPEVQGLYLPIPRTFTFSANLKF